MLEEELKEAGGSLDDQLERVRVAWSKYREGHTDDYSWVCDVFPDHAVVRFGDYAAPRYFKVGYTVTDDTVTFAAQDVWAPVKLAYVAASEDSPDEETTVEESFRGFIEAPRGKPPEAVIIVEGESANKRLYTEAALQSGIEVFSGRAVFADHPTAMEESQRPERSVRDVVGRLGKAYVGTDKAGKPALRAPLTISEAEAGLKTKIIEGILGQMSIRAQGIGHRSKDGVFVVESFVDYPHTSVDLVTVAAAGGYVELSESIREPEQEPEPIAAPIAEAQPSQELILLRESHRQLLEENTRLFHAARSNEGQLQFAKLIRQSTLSTTSRQQVWERAQPLLEAFATYGSEQTIDQLKIELGKLVEAEVTYLAKLVPNGAVSGLPLPVVDEKTPETILTEAFRGLVPDDKLSIAVQGRQFV